MHGLLSKLQVPGGPIRRPDVDPGVVALGETEGDGHGQQQRR